MKTICNNAAELTAAIKDLQAKGKPAWYPSAPVSMAGSDGHEKYKSPTGKTVAVRFPVTVEPM